MGVPNLSPLRSFSARLQPHGTRSVRRRPRDRACSLDEKPSDPAFAPGSMGPHPGVAAVACASILGPVVAHPGPPLLTVEHAPRLLSTTPTAPSFSSIVGGLDVAVIEDSTAGRGSTGPCRAALWGA